VERERPGRSSIGAVLRDRDIGRYLLGQAISITGSWMQMVALGWLAFELTGSPVAVGAVTAARTLPVLVLSVPAGVVGDRMDRRRVIAATCVLSATAATLLAVLSTGELLTFGSLLVLSALAGAGHAIEMPTYNAFLGQLAGPRLMSAVALNGIVFNIGRIVGPAIGGLLLAADRAAAVFAFNALSYGVFVLLVLSIDLRPSTSAETSRAGGAREAFRHVLADRRLAVLLGLLAVHTLTMAVPVVLAAPVAAGLGSGAAGTGLLVAAAGGGAIVALVVIARLGDLAAGGRGLLIAGAIGASGQLALAAVDSLGPGLVAMAASGGAMVAYTAISNALIQTIGPDALRGRLMSFYALVLPGIAPFSALAAGLLAGALGLDLTLVLMAMLWLVALTVAAMTSAGFRALGTTRPDPVPARQV
jgi:MFS family permease